MSAVLEAQSEVIGATARVAMYSLLAVGLSRPDPGRLELLATRLLPATEMLRLPEPLATVFHRTVRALPTDLDTARHGHISLFPPIASQDAPGYETGYRGDGIFQQTEVMADIAGFYRAHGLRAGGSEMERPDHIVVELDFMAVLARKEALALKGGSAEKASICRDTATAFLGDHLGCWAPAFGLRAAAVASSPWLQGLGELVALWVELDMDDLGVRPVEVVDGPLLQEPPDELTCGPCPVATGEPGL